MHFRLDEEGPLFTGRISDALLQEGDGARRLDVEVEVLESDGVRFRRHARYGYFDEIDAETQRATLPGANGADESAAAPSPPRRFVGLGPMLCAACAGALGGWLAASLSELMPAHPQQPVHLVTPARMSAADPPRGEAELEPPRASVAAALPSLAEAPVAQAAEAQPVVVLAEERADAPNDAPPIEPLDSPAARRPQVVVEGDVTRVLLPFEGTPEPLRPTLWASPHALALTLQQGRVALADGSHRLSDGGGVSGVRVHSRAGEQLLRLMLSAPISRYSVSLDDGVLELRLARIPESTANP